MAASRQCALNKTHPRRTGPRRPHRGNAVLAKLSVENVVLAKQGCLWTLEFVGLGLARQPSGQLASNSPVNSNKLGGFD